MTSSTVVQDWPVPETTFDIQSMKNCTPVNSVDGERFKIQIVEKFQKIFETLREVFIRTLILTYFDKKREMVVEMNPSELSSASILSQHEDDGVLHPVAYYSKKTFPSRSKLINL